MTNEGYILKRTKMSFWPDELLARSFELKRPPSSHHESLPNEADWLKIQ